MKKENINIFERIGLWWRFEGRYYHRDFICGVKNLIRWFPTIWKDRDWDAHFIWDIMIQKLKFQSKYIREKDFHLNAKRDSEIMMTCVRLMEKIKSEEYVMEYMDYHESEFNFVNCDKPGYKELKINELSENFDEYFKKYPIQYKRVLSGKINTFTKNGISKTKIAMDISHENHNRARKLLFKLMERNIERWWN